MGRTDSDFQLSRRACLAGGTVALASPRAALGSAPSRIAALEWTAAELLLTLGVTPVAIGDVRGYRDWVVEPALPSSVLDLGTRFEPNLEFVRLLAPDLIVATRDYGLGATQVRRVGAVVEIAPHPAGAPPLAHAEAEARALATRIGRLAEVDEAVRRLNGALDSAFVRVAGHRDPVCLVSLFEGRTARVYGAGGLAGTVLERVGLRNAWREPVNPWGFTSIGIDRLAFLPNDARVVAFEPIPMPVQALLAGSTLWNDMPFIRAGRFSTIPPVWPYGGLAAATRLAGLLADAFA